MIYDIEIIKNQLPENNLSNYWFSLEEDIVRPKFYLIDFAPNDNYEEKSWFNNEHWTFFENNFLSHFTENTKGYDLFEKIRNTIFDAVNEMIPQIYLNEFRENYDVNNMYYKNAFQVIQEDISQNNVLGISCDIAIILDTSKALLDNIWINKLHKTKTEYLLLCEQYSEKIITPIISIIDNELKLTIQESLFETQAGEYLNYVKENNPLSEIVYCSEKLDGCFLELIPNKTQIDLKTIDLNVWKNEYEIQKESNNNSVLKK
ncbi:hypothetical protein [Mycoplasma sp. 2634B]|uniref:hypothetical protein n=1 Tax=Mycoplasma sp. 2634B TaxID=3401692 RepID=UPI003AB0D783